MGGQARVARYGAESLHAFALDASREGIFRHHEGFNRLNVGGHGGAGLQQRLLEPPRGGRVGLYLLMRVSQESAKLATK